MAARGWYPDPAGAPNRFRYWDGHDWSDETTQDPRQPPPPGLADSAQDPNGQQPNRRKKSPAMLILGAAVLVLVLIIAGVLVVRQVSGRPIAGGPLPTSTVSGWDDSSPFPSDSPMPSPSDSATDAPGGQVECPHGGDSTTPDQADGRIHGGGLSFPQIESYDRPGPQFGFSWTDDVQGQRETTEPGWVSYVVVGSVQVGSGFKTAKQAASSSIQCAITSGWYPDFTGAKALKNEAITVDGAKGWVNTTRITNPEPGLSVDGDIFTAVVLDTGQQDRFSIFYAMTPTGDQPRTAIADQALANLTVD